MAYRKIHDNFWTDPDIEDLTPEQKFFYIYLITNPNVNQIGLYEFSIKRACFETGYNKDTIEKLMDWFENAGKIRISKTTHEILVIKFYHHNKSNSPKVQTHVDRLLIEVKDTSLIQYIYGMDTASQEEEVQVQSKEEEEEQTCYPFEYFWDDYEKKKDKAVAERKWKKIPEKDRDLIQRFIPIYKNHQPDSQFRKNPSTFLNQKIWKDDWSAYPPKSEQQKNNKNGNYKTKGDRDVEVLQQIG